MEKLLHERLREAIKSNRDFIETESGVSITALYRREIEALADEIERYYIPRPRFEDGEPLNNGDEIDYHGYAEKVVSYRVCDKPSDDADYGMRHAYATLRLKCGAIYNAPLDEPLKRPTPNVLDADGVEINVGDTVWFANSGTERTVKSLRQNDDGGYEIYFTNNLYCTNPDQLTHKRPVFDADGERIKVGDTVWNINTGNQRYIVLDISVTYGFYKRVKVENQDGEFNYFANDKLTHREPDSLEKLRDIICQCANDAPYKSELEDELLKAVDMVTALIERGA